MKRPGGSEPARAAVLANKDSKTKKAQKEVADTSSDSDVETALAAEARKKRDKKLKRTLQENGSLDSVWNASLQMQQQSKKLNWLS
jgi:hypothetical protein